DDIASSIALGPGGSVFVTGTSDSTRGVDYGGGTIGGGLYTGPFFVELDTAGNHVCSRSYPGDEGPKTDAAIQFVGANAHAVAAGTNSFTAGGSFAAVLDLGKGPMTSGGGTDLWLADFAR